MAGNFRKFRLLLWKNGMLQKRQPLVTVLEVLLPLTLFLITFIVRGLVPFNAITEPTTWDSFQVDQFPPFLIPPRGGLKSSWGIAYAPNNTLINRVMAIAAARINATTEGLGFQTEEDLEDYFMSDVTGTVTVNTLLGVVFADNFADNDHFSENITYKIRPKSQQVLPASADTLFESEWFTNIMYPIDAGINGPRQKSDPEGGDPGYYRQGFLTVQKAVDEAVILEVNQSADVDEIQLEMKRAPFPPYTSDDVIYFLQSYLSFTFILSFIVTAPTIVKEITLEKEKKLKETMKLMGLSNWLHWCAWFTKYFIFMFVIVVLATVCLFANNGGASAINYSNWFLVFVFILLYTTATIFFCFAVSVFFSKASTGAAAGGILFLLTYLPYIFIQFRYYEMSVGEKVASSLLHNVAMSYGCYLIALSESRGVGLTWDNFDQPVNAEDSFTFALVLLMLLIDCIIYALITWYVDAVYPGDFGIPKPFYFPCMKSYWCGEDVTGDDHTIEDGGVDLNDPSVYEKNFALLVPSIKIRALRKVFGKGKTTKVAVESLNLDIYENQITALLGHNGAGKTTTMFMLTGFIPPSSGGATVYGYDIRKDTDEIRESLGYCPQHDILFDNLTVYEHMYFFAKLRGIDGSLVENEITVMLKKLNLEKKRDALSSSLSGGMKRRLSVGIAFLGNTKIVILDEPTSGMDPEARRQIWDILEWERKGRTIILSTHFMEEADYLGDRVAIMAQGKLQCCGSSLFLKSKYGIGYHMRIVKTNSCDVSKVTSVIHSYVPLARLENNVSTELTYVLPRDSVGQFATMFAALEHDKKALGITSFGASLTTLEEVFLKVGEIADQADADAEVANAAKTNGRVSPRDVHVDSAMNGHSNGHSNGNSNGHSNGYSNGHSNGAFVTDVTVENGVESKSAAMAVEDLCLDLTYERNHGITRFFQQFCAMLLKRIIHTWKNRLVTAVQLLVPLGFTIVICIVIETLPKPTDPEPLLFNLDQFTTPISPYSLYNVTNGDTAYDLSRVYSSYLSQQDVKTPVVIDTSNNGTQLFIEDYLIDAAVDDFQTYIRSYITAATFESNVTAPEQTNDTWATRVWSYFNNEAIHSPAISLSIFSNTLMQYFGNSSFDIYTLNHPLPRFDNVKVRQTITQQQVLGSTVSSNISFGMAFLIATFVLFLVKERACGAKHLQFVAGVHVANFWTSTFLWDFINFMIPSFLLLAVFAIFQLDAYSKNIGLVLLIFVLFGWSVLPSVYLVSFLFTVAASAFVWTLILNIFTGIASVLIVSILSLYDSTYQIKLAVEWIFYILLPNYCFGQSLQNLYVNYETLQACNELKANFGTNFTMYCRLLAFGNQTNPCCENNCGDECASYNKNLLAWENPGVGRGLTFMGVQGAVFLFCLFLLESQVFRRFWQSVKSGSVRAAESRKRSSSAVGARQKALNEEDEDVRHERDKILSTSLDNLVNDNAVVLRNVRKFYDTHLAVRGLSFAIPRGECFGLLGVNGAGKTTTFKMLSGDETISDGDAYLAKSNISKQVRRAQQKLGYCPQFDGIVDQMTVTETLTMYARLRGIREADISRVVEVTIKNLLLQQHANRQAQLLSGGNKRKLCTAIALVGDPPIICLDEPTTGMDPGARRYLWKVLTGLREKGRTIILTSHSMEECEALCSRIAIMVNGQLKCLGSSQHLKTKFGDGYTAIAKLRSSDMDSMQRQTKTMMDFIEQTFPGSTLKDKHNGLLHYQIPSSCATWSSVFAAMEQARKLVDIDDYAVSEVTLEQVFIGFAREQVPPEIITASCWSKLIGCCCCYCLRSDKSQQHDDETQELPSTDRSSSVVSVETKL